MLFVVDTENVQGHCQLWLVFEIFRLADYTKYMGEQVRQENLRVTCKPIEERLYFAKYVLNDNHVAMLKVLRYRGIW
jgi:hypothetical protein